MATNAYANVRGKVFRTDHREGIGRESNKPYTMDIVTVLVKDGGLTEVVLPKVLPADALEALHGEEVDFLVEIFRNQKGFGMNVVKNDPLVESYSQQATAAA